MTNLQETHTNPLAHGLIRDDAKSYFLGHLEQIYDVWVPLLDKTTFRPNEASDDKRLEDAFKELNQHIVSPNQLKSRLGAIRFTQFLASLKGRIRADRRSRRVAVKKRSDSVAIDAYLQAQGPVSEKNARDHALKRVRISKRWHDMTRGSPLLAVIHTPKAEHIISDIRISNKALIQLDMDIRFQCPSELLEAADYLRKIGESGVEVEDFRRDHLTVLRGILGVDVLEDFIEI